MFWIIRTGILTQIRSKGTDMLDDDGAADDGDADGPCYNYDAEKYLSRFRKLWKQEIMPDIEKQNGTSMAQIFHYVCKTLRGNSQTILRQNFKSLFVAWRDNVASPAEAASAAATATKSGITCYATKEEEKEASSLQAVLDFCSKMSSTESARPTQARSKITAAQYLHCGN